MDKNLKIALSDLFNNYCFALAEKGDIIPTYFLIKDKNIIMMQNKIGTDFSLYASFVGHQATIQNADALVLVTENQVVVGEKGDQSIKALMEGNLKVSDHPENEAYLILAYMSNKGEKEVLFGKIEKDPCGMKFIKKHEWATDISTQVII